MFRQSKFPFLQNVSENCQSTCPRKRVIMSALCRLRRTENRHRKPFDFLSPLACEQLSQPTWPGQWRHLLSETLRHTRSSRTKETTSTSPSSHRTSMLVNGVIPSLRETTSYCHLCRLRWLTTPNRAGSQSYDYLYSTRHALRNGDPSVQGKTQ